MHKTICSGIAAITLSAMPFGALAADLVPAFKAPPGAVVSSSGLYFWADGSAQSIKLPTYGLGYKNLVTGALLDAGPINTIDPRATGYGMAGAVGYILPYGTL